MSPSVSVCLFCRSVCLCLPVLSHRLSLSACFILSHRLSRFICVVSPSVSVYLFCLTACLCLFCLTACFCLFCLTACLCVFCLTACLCLFCLTACLCFVSPTVYVGLSCQKVEFASERSDTFLVYVRHQSNHPGDGVCVCVCGGGDLGRREGKREEGGRSSYNVQWAFQLSLRNSATLKTISCSLLCTLPSSYKL